MPPYQSDDINEFTAKMTADRDESSVRQEHAPLRSFGRRRARKLSPRQNELLDSGLREMALDLSKSCPDNPAHLFGEDTKAVWLEIGFGGGEHLLWQARDNPDIGFLGCEPFIDGVVKVLDGASKAGLNNIRLHADDARDVLPWLPSASIARAFLLFPDPWPKKRHLKRRLVNAEMIGRLARLVAPDGELRLATDIPDYARGMLAAVRKEGSFRWLARQPSDWRIRPGDWPETKYERKALREGRKRYFLRFRRLR